VLSTHSKITPEPRLRWSEKQPQIPGLRRPPLLRGGNKVARVFARDDRLVWGLKDRKMRRGNSRRLEVDFSADSAMMVLRLLLSVVLCGPSVRS
jgi:hypothetical protein